MKDEFSFLESVDKIIEKDSRYDSQAYLFVMNALNFTVKKSGKRRHITGRELSEGIRLYAIEQFGSMARAVFEHWGVQNTQDFGNIVFNMIKAKLLSKTEEDSIEDFKDIYDFKEAFDGVVEYKLR